MCSTVRGMGSGSGWSVFWWGKKSGGLREGDDVGGQDRRVAGRGGRDGGARRDGRRTRLAAGRGVASVRPVRELVVVQAARELRLLEVGGDVLVGHLLETGLEKVDLLDVASWLAHVRRGNLGRDAFPQPRHTSSSLQARPPPVDGCFRFFCTP